MQLIGKALRVIIYIGESDRYQGKALYMALLELLKKEGASGATVVRGLAGFGARSRIHTATILTLSEDLPLRLEWVDQPEVVERVMPQVRQMVDAGLITVEEVDVIQYAPGRRVDPLLVPVGDVMRREVVTVSPETPVAEVVRLLLLRGYRSLPVVDGAGLLLGVLTDGDLLRRASMGARLDLQDAGQLGQGLGELSESQATAGDIMTRAVISVREIDSLGDAVKKMVENKLKRLPVIAGEGHLVGWVSRVDVLRTLEYHHLPAAERQTEPLRRGATVTDLMYRDAPTVAPTARLEEILLALEKNRRRRAVVVDDDGQVLGIITDGDLLLRSGSAGHPGLLERLRRIITGQPGAEPLALPHVDETAADLMSAPAITIHTETSFEEALRLMLGQQVKRLPVVDGDGRLVGLLGRGGLLQGLLRQP